MIEIALPKISSIGHVDIAFRLKSNVSEIPNVKVALLFYKMDAQKGTAPVRHQFASYTDMLNVIFTKCHLFKKI